MGKPLFNGIRNIVVHPTRFAGLGYGYIAPGHWQFIDTSDERDAQIGPIYPLRSELVADIDRFARERGYEDQGPAKPLLIPSKELTEQMLRA